MYNSILIIKKNKNIYVLLYSFILYVLISSNFIIKVYAEESDAINNINSAEKYIVENYLVIKKYELINVNVTNYIDEINAAVENLENAKYQLNGNNYTKSLILSNRSIDISNKTSLELNNITLQQKNVSFQILTRLFILIIIGIILLYLWKKCKKIYNKKILETKPMVNQIEH